ncbi:MAG: basic amino acid ABC transporter substrate-binding protein, partial [Chloroflexi bacterium]|nr:basic amino acid ABC transporter substrate-binding protein [Chloroflexota bacterium]
MKRFSFTMLLAVLMAIVTACGQSGTGTDSTGASPAASAAASAPASSAAAGGSVPDLGGRKVVVGTDATYPPMESVDAQSNQIVGFDVDVMTEIGKLANFTPEFQNTSFDTIFTALQSKQFDAVMSSVTITDERKKIVAFSEPYITVGQVIVVQNDNTTITSAEALANAQVGVQTGTTGEEAALNVGKVPDANLRRYQTIDLAFADLANDTIDAVVVDSVPAADYSRQPQYEGKIKIVGEPFTTEDYGIAVQQGDTELLNAINAGI